MNIRGPWGATGAQGLPGDAGKDGRSIENRGKWATNTEYDVGDMVTSPYLKSQTGLTEPAAVTGHFVCITEHTSKDGDVINTKNNSEMFINTKKDLTKQNGNSVVLR